MADKNMLHFVADQESLTVEVLHVQEEQYFDRGIGGSKIPCLGLRVVAWAHYQNGKKLPQPLPFTSLLKGSKMTSYNNGIRTLQY